MVCSFVSVPAGEDGKHGENGDAKEDEKEEGDERDGGAATGARHGREVDTGRIKERRCEWGQMCELPPCSCRISMSRFF